MALGAGVQGLCGQHEARHVLASLKEPGWAITPRMNPVRDTTLMESTPIGHLDFASPISGRGRKTRLGATTTRVGETTSVWGCTVTMSLDVQRPAEPLFEQLLTKS